jgi:hypothetical protein
MKIREENQSIAKRIDQWSNREQVRLLNFGASTLHLTD